MPRHTIFWPVLCLVLWTFLVLVQVPIRRFHAAFKGRVVAADFRCGESEYVPADVALPNRVFMNLVEVPTLFYVVCLILYVTGTVTPACVALAWLYFAPANRPQPHLSHLQPRGSPVRGIRRRRAWSSWRC